jgi:uncharacterized protein (PEP-CTERM system associated)
MSEIARDSTGNLMPSRNTRKSISHPLGALLIAGITIDLFSISLPAVGQELPDNGPPVINQPPSQPVLESGTLVFGSTATSPPFPPTLGTFLGYAGAPVTYSGSVFLLPERQLSPTAPAPGEPVLVEGLFPPSAYPVPSSVLLPPVVSGAVPIQAGDVRAPEIIIKPSLGISQGYDDNPRLTPGLFSDSVNHFNPGLLVSADTPHLQGLLSYSLDYQKYARASDVDGLTQSAVGYGLATIVPGAVYVDARGQISEISTTGGAGFATNPSILSPSERSQVMTASITPIVRQSFGNLVDTDLRYTFGMANFSNPFISGNTLATSPSLGDIRVNQGTLSVAVGRGYGTAASRLTLDVTDIGSTSVAQSDQFRGFDDLEYRLTNRFALLARVGYESLQYDTAGLRIDGPIVKVGARADLAPNSVATLLYGRQDGIWSFEGRFQQQVTASTFILGSYQRSVSSQQQLVFNNLNSSRLDAFGTIVNYDTALPGGVDPGFVYSQTDIYRYQTVRLGVNSDIGRNSFRIFGFLDHEASLTHLTPNDTSRGILVQWFRSITPRLTGAVGIGYATTVSSNGKTATADFDLGYQINDAVTAFARYDFLSQQRTPAHSNTRRDLVELGLKATY